MDYQGLVFDQKVREVTRGIYSQIQSWPKNVFAQDIARQLLRASTSVGANIAEGHGRHIGVEYIHYLHIAQGSANEVDHWLHTALDCKIGSPEILNELIRVNYKVRKMLATSIGTLRKRYSDKLIRESLAPYSLSPSPLDPELPDLFKEDNL